MARRMSKAKKRLIGGIATAVLVVGIAVPFSCIPRPPDGTRTPERVTVREAFRQVAARPVRVLLVSKQPTATVGTTASYSILSADGSQTLARGEGESLPESIVRATSRGLDIGGAALPHAALRIRPVRDGAAMVNGRRYRGELLCRRESDGTVSIINLLPLDSYLYSVLGSETYASWPDAAHDAQAIVARTYTLWRMIDRNDKHFDVHASVQDQSYQGVAKETPRLRAAVDRTAGVVLLYQAKLFRAYYHSTCGGHTEAVEDYFPDAPLLPLSGVRCDYCQASKHYRWRRDIVKADVAKALRADGVPLHQVAAVEVLSRTKSGRADLVAVEDGEGRRHRVAAARFRLAIGAATLPSTWFEVYDRGASIEFRGRGWGHGVGMCQWGARGMAEAGYGAEDILRHYYTGATLERLYNRPAP